MSMLYLISAISLLATLIALATLLLVLRRGHLVLHNGADAKQDVERFAQTLEVTSASVNTLGQMIREDVERLSRASTVASAESRTESLDWSEKLRTGVFDVFGVLNKTVLDSLTKAESTASRSFETFSTHQTVSLRDLTLSISGSAKELMTNVDNWRETQTHALSEGRQEQMKVLTSELTGARNETRAASESLRTSLVGGFSGLSETVINRLLEAQTASRTTMDSFDIRQKESLDVLGQVVTKLATDLGVNVESWRDTQLRTLKESRDEQSEALGVFRQTLDTRLERMSENFLVEQNQARTVIAESLEAVRRDNETKLEQMRATVQEKLDTTLGERLDASFKLVTEQLATVHRGLGEMQVLAQGVGSLQRTLTNVKTRGIWGELQLHTLLSDLLTPDQYERQCRLTPQGSELADFAIRMPGGEDGRPLRMAIDAKFPMDVFERFSNAWELGEKEAITATGKALEDRVVMEAQSIRRKYIHPPYTTDFAVLYLPTEGLYAEVARRPGLLHRLRSEHNVIIAGPTTLTALLSSLSMGFRTLAIQKRSSEAWIVLGKVKTEFAKSGEVWSKVVKQLETASRTAEGAGIRYRAVVRSLRDVELTPFEVAASEITSEPSQDQDAEQEIVEPQDDLIEEHDEPRAS